MLAYVVLLLAVLSRIVPPTLHLTAMNFTAVGGSLLFFGAKRSRWQTAVAVMALMMTDIYLTTMVYHYSFHMSGYVLTWAWYAGVCLLGHSLLKRVTILRTSAAVLTSATSFFVLSDFTVWLGTMYPHTLAGFGACYIAALPFYRNDVMSTTLVVTVLFGLPVLAARLVEGFRSGARLT